MNRRAFISTLAGGLLAAPLAAQAQQVAKIARIGWLAVHLAVPTGSDAERPIKGGLRQVRLAPDRAAGAPRHAAHRS